METPNTIIYLSMEKFCLHISVPANAPSALLAY